MGARRWPSRVGLLVAGLGVIALALASCGGAARHAPAQHRTVTATHATGTTTRAAPPKPSSPPHTHTPPPVSRSRTHTPAPAPPAHPRLPSDFLGIVSSDAFEAVTTDRAAILAGERRTGVQLIRQTFSWPQIEPRRGHFGFSAYDSFMVATARAGIHVLPIVFGLPAWEPARHAAGVTGTPTTTFPPLGYDDFAAFAAALARRYGPGGAFWRAHPALAAYAIRSWQIWNEPNLYVYWGERPDAHQYAAMLRAAGSAIRAVDPHAEIVTAGIPQPGHGQGIGLNAFVGELLADAPRGAFQTLAIDPYASTDAGVEYAVMKMRQKLDAAGLPTTPIWVTEFGWASGGPGSRFTVTERQQADFVLDAITTLGRLASKLHVRGLIYDDWRDEPPYPGGVDFWGLHTGLESANGDGKPALNAYYVAAGVLGTLPQQQRQRR